MAEHELQILINGIFSRIKEKYGYTDEQALIYLQGYQDCAEENQQSLEWRDKMLRDAITELCEAKRLLKAAMEDIVWLNEHTVDGEGRCLIETATDTETCLACPLNVNNSHICG